MKPILVKKDHYNLIKDVCQVDNPNAERSVYPIEAGDAKVCSELTGLPVILKNYM
ncbi:MAG: hypothetical protein ACFB0B_04760 [Thermonemataceae bacterium]